MTKQVKKEEELRAAISVKLPVSLVQWIDQQAEAETRTRSNFIEVLLKKARADREPLRAVVERKGEGDFSQLASKPRVAEVKTPPNYGIEESRKFR